MVGMVALLRNICRRACRDDAIESGIPLLLYTSQPPHGTEKSVCHRNIRWNRYSWTATDFQAVKVADHAISVSNLGATPYDALAVVCFGRGQCLQETRLSRTLVANAQPAAGSLKGIEKLPTEVASADRQQCPCRSGLIRIPTFFPIGPDIFPLLVFSASRLTSQALWESRVPTKNISSSRSPSFSSAPLVCSFLLRSWWCEGQSQLLSNGTSASTSALFRVSSSFHENLVVAPDKTARAPTQETS